MQKIGFLGGTFNPIHNGHFRIALEAFEELGLDALHFVPTFDPVHKNAVDVLDFPIRVELIQAAIEEYELEDIFSVSEHESLLDEGSYTIYSLQKWNEIHGSKPYFIVGIEDFVKLDTWRYGFDLPQYAHFAVMKRADLSFEDFEKYVAKFWPDEAKKIDEHSFEVKGSILSYFETTRLDISATNIRQRSIEGKSLCCLLPRVIEEFIILNEDVIELWQNK